MANSPNPPGGTEFYTPDELASPEQDAPENTDDAGRSLRGNPILSAEVSESFPKLSKFSAGSQLSINGRLFTICGTWSFRPSFYAPKGHYLGLEEVATSNQYQLTWAEKNDEVIPLQLRKVDDSDTETGTAVHFLGLVDDPVSDRVEHFEINETDSFVVLEAGDGVGKPDDFDGATIKIPHEVEFQHDLVTATNPHPPRSSDTFGGSTGKLSKIVYSPFSQPSSGYGFCGELFAYYTGDIPTGSCVLHYSPENGVECGLTVNLSEIPDGEVLYLP